MIASNSRPFAGQSGLPSPARGAFPHFVWTVLARCFADLVRPFSLLRFPRLTLSPQLITQHSRPIPPYMFDLSLPPTSPSTFSLSSLPIPRSAPDCRRLDAMDRSDPRCVCPVIDAVHYRSVWCFPDELRGIGRCHCRHFPRPSSTGVHRSRFGAHEDRVGLWDVDVRQLMGRSSRNTWNRTSPGRPSV
jgi:hypothetical protein